MPDFQYELPYDLREMLTEHSTEFDAVFALGDVEQWFSLIGHEFNSDVIRTVYPIPLSGAGYRIREGDDKMRRVGARSCSVSPKEWCDGIYEYAKILRKGRGFLGWDEEIKNMALEALRFPAVLVADLLRLNANLDFYRTELPGGSTASTIALFASNHPVHVLDAGKGTFDNDFAAGDTLFGQTVPTEINAVLVEQMRMHFAGIKGPNGRVLGLQFEGFLIPSKHAENALNAFSRDAIIELVKNVAATENVGGVAMPNRHLGTRVLVAHELTGTLPSGLSGDEDTLYPFASKPGGAHPYPWIVQRGSPEEIIYDESDAMYKDEGKVGLKRVISAAASGCLPHAIARVDLSP